MPFMYPKMSQLAEVPDPLPLAFAFLVKSAAKAFRYFSIPSWSNSPRLLFFLQALSFALVKRAMDFSCENNFFTPQFSLPLHTNKHGQSNDIVKGGGRKEGGRGRNLQLCNN